MRKTWVKKENIYYKPWYKQKFKMSLLLLLLLAIIFFSYQVFYISQLDDTEFRAQTPSHDEKIVEKIDKHEVVVKLTNSPETHQKREIVKGIRVRDIDLYSSKLNLVFKCFKENKSIAFEQINDNFCDCLADGSDEPGTDACANGVFYCRYQTRHKTGRGKDVFIPSGKVNDGIPDCCDGSDENISKLRKFKAKCT